MRIRNARSGLGQRSFRYCPKPKAMPRFSVMLEKRLGCCCTDGPIRVLSCQMRQTIAAIKAVWCALCVKLPVRVRPTSPAARSSPQLAASAESLLTDTGKHHPAANQPQEFPLFSPKSKVMARFSLGDVGEAPWLLSHRWTDTSPILPDTAHDSRNQGRVVSLFALNLLSACVRLRQLREVHHNLQQVLNPCSRTQRAAATDGSLALCISLILRLCVMLRVPSQYSVHSLLVVLLCKHAVWAVLFEALQALA